MSTDTNQTGTNQTGTNQTGTNQTGTNQTGTNETVGPEIVELTWAELVDTVKGAGEGVFLATTGSTRRPHVSWVMPGWDDERLWLSIFADSQKATNLRTCTATAMTCAATPDTNVIIRATARLVTDRAEATHLWHAGVLPYDPGMFFTGPEDPQTQFVELVPTHASVRALGPGPVRRWRPTTR